MRLIIAFFMLFVASQSFATGKITLQGNYLSEDYKTIKPMVGFSVYQKVARNLFVNAWAGYGSQPLENRGTDLNWYVAKAQLDFQMKRLTIAPGVQHKNLPDENFHDTYPYIRVDYQLW